MGPQAGRSVFFFFCCYTDGVLPRLQLLAFSLDSVMSLFPLRFVRDYQPFFIVILGSCGQMYHGYVTFTGALPMYCESSLVIKTIIDQQLPHLIHHHQSQLLHKAVTCDIRNSQLNLVR